MTLTDGTPSTVAAYEPPPGYDEAFSAPGAPRPHYAKLLAALDGCDLEAVAERITGHMRSSGATFGAGELFRLDPIPRLLTAREWAQLEDGLAQRVRALDSFVADVYGERDAVRQGVLPERVLDGIEFHEDLGEVPPPPGSWIGIAGLDVVRDAEGCFRVLEDNVRTPSGMAYALIARHATSAHLPYDGRWRNIAAELATYLRLVIAAARPEPEAGGISVLLTDGPKNPAWYEHGVLAEMGELRLTRTEELVVAGDRLALRDGRRVQVVYRRTNEDRLRDARGRLTDVGEVLWPALQAGTVGVVNFFGTGVADDKRVYPYVDDLVRFYLGEEPLVHSVPTLDLGDPRARAEALERLDELVVKPRGGFGGIGVVIGPAASAKKLDEARRAIEESPGAFVAQETIRLSTHPTVVDGRLVPRHVDVRPFVFFDGTRARALPGGLTRVALREGELVVNSSQGGGGKDTWVLPS
ncbi:MAG TPA: circularly permuted type 2 ATP-grasp protein [Solirubrobacteraceae bacterium]|jgi:carboxylate-amine ligase